MKQEPITRYWEKYAERPYNQVRIALSGGEPAGEEPYVPKTFGDLFPGGDQGEADREQPLMPLQLFKGVEDLLDESDDAYVPPRLFDKGGRK